MGTNYYHEKEPLNAHRCAGCSGALHCPKCDGEPRVHIGKSSVGWTFSFHATDTIRSYVGWLEALASGGRIVDEYGREVSLRDFVTMVRQKRSARSCHALSFPRDRNFVDESGNSFSEGEFS